MTAETLTLEYVAELERLRDAGKLVLHIDQRASHSTYEVMVLNALLSIARAHIEGKGGDVQKQAQQVFDDIIERGEWPALEAVSEEDCIEVIADALTAQQSEIAAKEAEIAGLRDAIERVSIAADDKNLPPELHDAIKAALQTARAAAGKGESK